MELYSRSAFGSQAPLMQREAMPKYLLDIHIGGDVLSDPEGQSLRDPDQAWEVTCAMALNLMDAQFDKPVNWASSHIEVKDDLKGVQP
jgi:hypothetical protein